MFTISKQFTFCASHQLTHLPDDHPCARIHGHNYVVEVVIQCPALDDRGFCQVDYRELDPFKRWIDEHLDHRHLNDVLPVLPTAENIAKLLLGVVRELVPDYVRAVRVSETPRTWATYEAPN
jgi:6-pyruvoyltetrahydropterin/6-carboxytetrahydropterin synthase